MNAVASSGETEQPGTFGRMVKRLREERSMSQERLAELAGMTGGYVSQIETGTRGVRPGRDKVLGIAQALRVPPAELLRAAGRLEPGDEVGDDRPSFEDFVHSDPNLRIDQKDVLVRMYRSWVGHRDR